MTRVGSERLRQMVFEQNVLVHPLFEIVVPFPWLSRLDERSLKAVYVKQRQCPGSSCGYHLSNQSWDLVKVLSSDVDKETMRERRGEQIQRHLPRRRLR